MLGQSRRSIATVVLALIAAVVAGCLGFASASTTDVRVYDAGVGPTAAAASARPAAPAAGNHGEETPPEGRARVYDERSQLAHASARVGGYRLAPRAPGIKPGAAGGPTAGQRFSTSVRDAAELENPTATCVFCRTEGVATHVDHAIPRVRGGNATLENAQLACPWCNLSKGARDFPVNPPPWFEGRWPPPWWLE